MRVTIWTFRLPEHAKLWVASHTVRYEDMCCTNKFAHLIADKSYGKLFIIAHIDNFMFFFSMLPHLPLLYTCGYIYTTRLLIPVPKCIYLHNHSVRIMILNADMNGKSYKHAEDDAVHSSRALERRSRVAVCCVSAYSRSLQSVSL